MILFHDLLVERASFPVPSTHHQTLLSKTIFEHCLDYSQVASIALTSKSIQNSSLSPNFASNIIIDEKSVKLFETVLHPSTSLPLQFVPQLKWSCGFLLSQYAIHSQQRSTNAISNRRTPFLVHLINSSKYFTKSLRTFTLQSCTVSDFLRVFAGLNQNNSITQFTCLEHLDFDDCVFTQRDVDTINASTNQVFPRLQTVSVLDRPDDYARVVAGLRNLKCLTAPGQNGVLAKVLVTNPPKLDTLVLSAMYGDYTKEDLEKLGATQLGLTTLAIVGARGSGVQGLELLTNLTSLNLCKSIMLANTIDWQSLLSSLPNLINLDLSCCAICEETFCQISKLEKIRSLNLESCSLPSVADADQLIKKYLPSLSSTLTELNLTGWPAFSGLAALCSLTKLRKLNLSSIPRVDDFILREIGHEASSMTEFQELIMIGCTAVNFFNVPVFRSMTKLDVRFSDINDNRVAGIKVSFPHLRELHLGADMWHQERASPSSDFNYYYSQRPRVTDIGLEHISSLCCLETLNLRDCSAITNGGLKLIFTRLQRLKFLSLKSCGDGVTDDVVYECIDDIHRRLSRLEVEYPGVFRSNKSLSKNVVTVLAACCPHLHFKSNIQTLPASPIPLEIQHRMRGIPPSYAELFIGSPPQYYPPSWRYRSVNRNTTGQ